jgi:phenylpropionate dioxygenase-like ring-hydroxylating dioxygenase large terminal subunit
MALTALTSPHHYLDADVFALERTRIFSRSWIFAGLANEIPAPNDYFRVDIAGRDIIVHNCGGQLRAFANVCSHRHSQIHEEACGNRPLVCRYHGWSYNDDGVPTGIPARENFPQVCANPLGFALQQFELQSAGHFIFIRLTSGEKALKEFLGEAFDFLVNASEGLDRNMDEFQGTLAANWKVVIENALEGYHVPMVHRATLGAIKQFSARKQDVVDHLPAGSGHSFMVNQANEGWLEKWRRFERALGRWPFKFDYYVHRLFFPNLTVTSFMGYSFHIQRFHPDEVGRTTVHSRIYSVRCQGQTDKGSAIMRSVYDEGKRFTQKVFGEDRLACERVYLGMRHAHRPAVLGEDLEKRLAHFQKFYLQALEEEDSGERA